MNKKFLQEQKEKLEKEKQAVVHGLKSFAAKDPFVKDDWDTAFPQTSSRTGSSGSLEEAADEVEEYSNTLPQEQSMEIKLRDINQALEKIEKGAYGQCEKCGKAISEDRMKVCPEAKMCSQCQ